VIIWAETTLPTGLFASATMQSRGRLKQKLRGGDIKMKPIQPDLKFDERSHIYKWRGRDVPSVTQVLSNVGVRIREAVLDGDGTYCKGEWVPVGFDDKWLKDDTAAQFGSAFHKVAAGILEGKKVNYPDAMEGWVEQFKRFARDISVATNGGSRLVECPLYSEKYGYCGTFDCLANAKDEKGVVLYDWKTGTGKESFWEYQLAAYAQLLSENFGYRNIAGTVVRFSESGYRVEPVLQKPGKHIQVFDGYTSPGFNGFRSCLNVYKMVRGE
jgi:hypothetical protein